MEILVVLILIGLTFVYVINPIQEAFRSDTKKTSTPKVKNTSSKPGSGINREVATYKQKKLRDYDLRGIQYRNPVQSDVGSFDGELKCEFNDHDKYAVGVYRSSDNKLLGFVPRGNYKLYNEVQRTESQSIPCWGEVWFDDYDNRWYGSVYAYVGFSQEELDLLIALMKLEDRIIFLTKRGSTRTQLIEAASLLIERTKYINDFTMRYAQSFHFNQGSNYVRIIKALHDDKKFKKILELNAYYNDWVELVPERSRKTTERRIDDAQNFAE